MKIKINKFTNIILVLVIFINFIQSQSIKDTTLLKNYNIYADDKGSCNYQFDFYIESDDIINSVSSKYGDLKILSTSTHKIYRLFFNVTSSSPLQNEITINGININYPTITCTSTPSTLNYELVSNIPNKVSNSEYNLNLIIDNINKILPESLEIKNYCPDYFVCKTSQVGFSNYFITSIKFANNGKNIQNSNFNIIYEFNNQNKTFSIKSPFSNINLNNNNLNLNSFYEINNNLKSLSTFLNINNGISSGSDVVNNVFLKFSNNQIKLLTPVLGALLNDSTIGIQLLTTNNIDSTFSSNVQVLLFSNGVLSVANQVNSQQTFNRSSNKLSSSGLSGVFNKYIFDGDVDMVTLSSSNSNYYNTNFNLHYNTPIQFPLGFMSISSKSNPATFKRELSININSATYQNTYTYNFEDKSTQVAVQNPDINDYDPPQIVSIQFETIGTLSIIRFEITDNTAGFLYLQLSNGVVVDSKYLVEGTLTDGIYEYIFNLLDYEYQSELRVTKICDKGLYCQTFDFQGYKYNVYNLNTGATFPLLGNPTISLSNITSFYFKQNSIDTTNQNVFTSVNFNLSNSNPQSDYPPYLELYNDGKSNLDYLFNQVIDKVIFQAYWNYELKMYQVDFTIRKNQFSTDDFIYWIVYQGERFSNTILQHKFNSKAKLSISSNYADTVGPTVSSITPLQSKYQLEITQDLPIKVGWKINIQDQFNGFQHGFIQLISQETGKLFNITLNPTITGLLDNEFDVYINLTGNCVSQHISIKQIYLQDTGGYSTYEKLDSSDQSGLSFSPLLNIKENPIIFVECNKIDESVLPSLVSLELSKSQLDVGGEDRNVKVTFEVYDNSGIDLSQMPICYLQSSTFEFHSTRAQIIKSNITNTQFLCDIETPIGFGYNDNILLSIYGIYDHSNLIGFSSKYLANNSFPYVIKSNSFTLSTPAIYSVGKFYSSDSKVTIIGRSLDNSFIQIDYLQGFGFENITGVQQPINSGSSSKINSLFISTINKIGFPFDIRVINSKTNQISNVFRVTPIISGSTIINSNNNNNNNSTCINECGGSEHGTCTSNGCQCKLPWTGLDCLSKITLIQNYTQSNTSKPTITLLNNNNDQLIKSIDILLLREVDNGGNIIQVFNLNQWSNVANKSDGFKYTTTIYKDSHPTTINVSTIWSNIKNTTNIQYQIDIGSYSFSSYSSKLELIVSNSLDKVSTYQGVVCSNSNYSVDSINSNIINNRLTMNQDTLLNQINLVALIDNSEGLISTNLLNSSSSLLNNGTNSKNSGDSIDNLVAIVIPQYNVMVSINSKYTIIKESIALQQQQQKNDKSLICVSKNIKEKDGLSDQQKAATAIGVIGFFIIAGIVLWFFIIKPKRDAQRLN